MVKRRIYDSEITLCELPESRRTIVDSYAKALTEAAPCIGGHGMGEQEFWDSGLFYAAVEKLRGTHAATMEQKKAFISFFLDIMKEKKLIDSWSFEGSDERHDYQVNMPDGNVCIIEAKGCLDGNNTLIFQRPTNADEFLIWSLCQNPGADPRHNAWSGIHTRLSADMISRKEKVDAVIIWDALCGSAARYCPKLKDPSRGIEVGDKVYPPPCIFLFPRTTPDPRNNPNPPVWQLSQLSFVSNVAKAFGCDDSDVVEVRIATRMEGSDVERQTSFYRSGELVQESKWTKIKRART